MTKAPLIGIIGGKGRMGKLFAAFFKEKGIKTIISDLKTPLSNVQLTKKSDIVIVSVPIDKVADTISEILPHLQKDSALMDFTSVKELPLQIMLKAPCEVLGIHPMFGNSNPIPGQTIILCPTKKSGKWSKWMEDFLIKNNVRIYKMSTKKHDKIMNIAQGLIHFAEITFGDALRQTRMPVNEILKYTGKASELKIQLAARIFDQDADLYGSIQIKNPQALNSLKFFKKAVDQLLEIVRKRDLKAFRNYFLKNRQYFGKYTKEAYKDSSFLIDKFLELKQNDKKITASIQKPEKQDFAVLGPKNTYTDLAADKYLSEFKHVAKKYFAKDIDEIFELVEQGRVDCGIVPIENSFHGTVRETLDALFYKNVHIVKDLKLPIRHFLIALKGAKKSSISKILSHSQALNQCKKYLKKHFCDAQQIPLKSTAAATEHLLNSKDNSFAAIASEIAANSSRQFQILAKNIEDSSDNLTTFIVIKKGPAKITSGATKTSIAFYFNADAPGTLFTVFKDFADNKINLTKIESRPTKKQFGDYIFYLDFHGTLKDSKVKKVLNLVEQKVAKLKILGSY